MKRQIDWELVIVLGAMILPFALFMGFAVWTVESVGVASGC